MFPFNLPFLFPSSNQHRDDTIRDNNNTIITNSSKMRSSPKVDDIEEGTSPRTNKVIISNLSNKSIQRSTSNRSNASVSTPNTLDEKGGSEHDDEETEALVGSGSPSKTQSSSSSSKALVSCINYSFCSVSMILVNKSLASRYDDSEVTEFFPYQNYVLNPLYRSVDDD